MSNFLIIIGVVALAFHFLMRYLDGDFNIDRVEIVHSFSIQGRKKTSHYVVHKITYESKRVKYKTVNYYTEIKL